MTVMCKTICVDCKHHNGQPAEATWYDHRCLHPTLERQPEQDPVTGLIGFLGMNDLATTYFTDEKHPYCRDYNQGNCEYFQSNRDG